MGGTICGGMLTIRSLSTSPTCDGFDALEAAASTERRDERVEWKADEEGSFERMYETSDERALLDCKAASFVSAALEQIKEHTTYLVNVQVEHSQHRVRIPLMRLVVLISTIRLDRTPDQLLLQYDIRHASQIQTRCVPLQELGEEQLDRVVVLRLRVEEGEVDVEHLRATLSALRTPF